jgi:hypothetical protein
MREFLSLARVGSYFETRPLSKLATEAALEEVWVNWIKSDLSDEASRFAAWLLWSAQF